MTIDTKKLRELAEAATPGPWTARGVTVNTKSLTVGFCNGLYEDVDDERDARAIRNAAFIAAASPATVIALLDEIERLRNSLALEHRSGAAIEDIVQRKDREIAAMTRARDEACDLVESAAEVLPAHSGPSGYRNGAKRLRAVGKEPK